MSKIRIVLLALVMMASAFVVAGAGHVDQYDTEHDVYAVITLPCGSGHRMTGGSP